MDVAYFGYRSWAEDILHKVRASSAHTITSFTTPDSQYHKSKDSVVVDPKNLGSLDLSSYKALLFYGWSWMVPQSIVDTKDCVCLHPSPLPKYRGGSPLQHQIINGEDKSAVSLFRMDKGLDSGPVYVQEPFSLSGSLDDIFSRIVDVGSSATVKLLDDFASGTARAVPQDESQASAYKRRKPSESELTPEMLRTMSSRQVYDFVRALADPYPNAFIKGSDGKKVYLKSVARDD